MAQVSINQMYEHLKLATKLEGQIYALENALSKINGRISKIKNVSYYHSDYNEEFYKTVSKNEYVENEYTSLFYDMRHMKVFGSAIISVICWCFFIQIIVGVIALIPVIINFKQSLSIIKNLILGNGFVFDSVLDLVLQGALAIALNGIIGAVEFIVFAVIRKSSRLSKLKRNYSKGKFRHQRLTNESNELQAKNELVLNNLTVQSNALLDELNRIKNLRSKLYSENLLPIQYRNLSAAATMCEWIATGRCTQIYGHGGLFDTWEYKLEHYEVMSELRSINSNLDMIRENQNELYQEVRRGNEITEKIYSSVIAMEKTQSKIASDIGQIKVNSSISAVASTRAAYYAEYNHYLSIYY